MKQRELRRNGGFLARCVKRLRWQKFKDERQAQGKRWETQDLLKWSILGLLCGAKGLGEIEELSERMAKALRRLCGVCARRLPDTTLRSFLCRLSWKLARGVLHEVVYAAERGKQLRRLEKYPFGVVSMDGKYQTLPSWEGDIVQRTSPSSAGGKPYGKLRLINSVLLSEVGRPCIDASPVPEKTNEMGHFNAAFDELKEKFGHLFEMVCYDAGALSAENAAHVEAAGKYYLFQLSNENHEQYKAASEYLHLKKDLVVLDNPKEKVEHRLRLFSVNEIPLGDREHTDKIFLSAKLLIRVETRRIDKKTGLESTEFRYYVTNAPRRKLANKTWLSLIIERWSVETCHQVLDVGFEEDDRPVIEKDTNGALVVSYLRRAAYTLLTLFKNVSLRDIDAQMMSHRALMRWLRDTAVAMTEAAASGIRVRKAVPALV